MEFGARTSFGSRTNAIENESAFSTKSSTEKLYFEKPLYE